MIKVLLVDDQQILAEGIKSVLETSNEVEVVGIASDGVRAIEAIYCAYIITRGAVGKFERGSYLAVGEAVRKHKRDFHFSFGNIRMPNMNGVVATQKIKEIDENIKIVILTTFDDSDLNRSLL